MDLSVLLGVAKTSGQELAKNTSIINAGKNALDQNQVAPLMDAALAASIPGFPDASRVPLQTEYAGVFKGMQEASKHFGEFLDRSGIVEEAGRLSMAAGNAYNDFLVRTGLDVRSISACRRPVRPWRK